MISFSHKGDFSITTNFLKKASKNINNFNFDKYGRAGVDALSSATPTDSGETAKSWKYDIIKTNNSVKITFSNTNIQNGIPIAILIQYGHATRNGGWVEGRDYINPAIQPIFDDIVNQAWGEVTKS